MRSTDSCLKGRVTSDLMGRRGGTTGCVRLVLLTDRATSNKVFYEGGKARPLEIPLQDGLGMKDPHMPR